MVIIHPGCEEGGIAADGVVIGYAASLGVDQIAIEEVVVRIDGAGSLHNAHTVVGHDAVQQLDCAAINENSGAVGQRAVGQCRRDDGGVLNAERSTGVNASAWPTVLLAWLRANNVLTIVPLPPLKKTAPPVLAWLASTCTRSRFKVFVA